MSANFTPRTTPGVFGAPCSSLHSVQARLLPFGYRNLRAPAMTMLNEKHGIVLRIQSPKGLLGGGGAVVGARRLFEECVQMTICLQVQQNITNRHARGLSPTWVHCSLSRRSRAVCRYNREEQHEGTRVPILSTWGCQEHPPSAQAIALCFRGQGVELWGGGVNQSSPRTFLTLTCTDSLADRCLPNKQLLYPMLDLSLVANYLISLRKAIEPI